MSSGWVLALSLLVTVIILCFENSNIESNIELLSKIKPLGSYMGYQVLDIDGGVASFNGS
jgi:hypothetical protein